LDYRLVEWANRQPLATKIGAAGGRYVTKRVLRHFAEKRLPLEIIKRPKRGFPVPVYGWFSDQEFRRWAVEHLTGRGARLKHLFKPDLMTRHLANAAGDLVAGQKCWLLIVLETWLREFDVDLTLDPSPSYSALVAD